MHTDPKTIYHQWIETWNGNLDLINEIISPDFVFHPTHEQPEQPNFNGRDGVRRMIEMSRTPFNAISFSTELGPFAEDDIVIGRWQGRGIYKGGLPGATAKEGTEVASSAVDILKVQDGRIVEYWHNADDLNFMLQVGAVTYTQ
jgi:predicted ester cyclase